MCVHVGGRKKREETGLLLGENPYQLQRSRKSRGHSGGVLREFGGSGVEPSQPDDTIYESRLVYETGRGTRGTHFRAGDRIVHPRRGSVLILPVPDTDRTRGGTGVVDPAAVVTPRSTSQGPTTYLRTYPNWVLSSVFWVSSQCLRGLPESTLVRTGTAVEHRAIFIGVRPQSVTNSDTSQRPHYSLGPIVRIVDRK